MTELSPTARFHVPDELNVMEQFVAATEAAGIGHGFYYSLTNNFYLNVLGDLTPVPIPSLFCSLFPLCSHSFSVLLFVSPTAIRDSIARRSKARLWSPFPQGTQPTARRAACPAKRVSPR